MCITCYTVMLLKCTTRTLTDYDDYDGQDNQKKKAPLFVLLIRDGNSSQYT